MHFWNWLGELKPAQAAILAALLGFLTLTAGHVINSWLNRRRDRFLLDLDRLNLLRSITIEIAQISRLTRNQISRAKAETGPLGSYSVINPTSLSVVYRNNLQNIHKLPPGTLMHIVPFYVAIQEYEYNLNSHGILSVGQHPSLLYFNISSHQLFSFIDFSETLDGHCQRALSSCYPVVRHLERKLEGRTESRPPTKI